MTISGLSSSLVASARIMVVGCGALGNEVLKNLALVGAIHIVVVDFDVVEPDNLARSVLFTHQDAQQGRYKAEAAAERLRNINPKIDITPVCGDIAYDVGLGLLMQTDVVIGCVDNRWARYAINRLCMRAGIPWVDGGIYNLEGTARVFAPGVNCYACNLGPEALRDLKRRMPCAGVVKRNIQAGKAPTNSITASIIGAVQVQEALKLLHKEEIESGGLTSLAGKMLSYEGEHLTTRIVSFKAYDPDCPVHEKWAPVLQCNFTNQCTAGDALQWMADRTGCQDVSILFTGDCFVDYVVIKKDNSRVEVMAPGRKVEHLIEIDEKLSGIPFSALYQNEYRSIDWQFPYPALTLEQLGVPDRDVVRVIAGNNEYYLELQGIK
ncbi:MAG: HesA/MoeB/ThiF family protein [Bacteroidales bacterium]|nr:HesA/MoeB/ThiF family protein [Bacteroidales bacterium]